MNGEPDFMKLYRHLGYITPFKEAKDNKEIVTPEDLKKVRAELNDPEKAKDILSRARKVWDSEITKDELKDSIDRAQRAFEETHVPGMPGLPLLIQQPPQERLPRNFKLPLAVRRISVDPNVLKFEKERDALGWILFAGPYWIQSLFRDRPKATFRKHNSNRTFIYDLPQAPLDIALFGDFGTGLYTSLYIAQQIKEKKFPYAIHLGDVYYAGTKKEFKENLAKPMEGFLKNDNKPRFFTMIANHEMLSGGFAYFEYLDTIKREHNQEQEGSYFCLRSNTFQIVGIDTDYFEEGRLKKEFLRKWLEDVLKDGKANNRINILLTANAPYKQGDKNYRSDLFREDLNELFVKKDMIDLWFWGDTHYCALFDRSDEMKFIGSCIGHGGFPYKKKKKKEEKEPTPVLFLETEPRFPEWTNLQQDFGNNGFCVLRLMPGHKIKLEYIDWLGDLRCEASLSRSADGHLGVHQFKEHVPRNEHRIR